MASDSFLRSLSAEPAWRAFCPSCRSEKPAVGYRNSEGHWYCRCLTCACRF
jgi:hypothetical protein